MNAETRRGPLVQCFRDVWQFWRPYWPALVIVQTLGTAVVVAVQLRAG